MIFKLVIKQNYQQIYRVFYSCIFIVIKVSFITHLVLRHHYTSLIHNLCMMYSKNKNPNLTFESSCASSLDHESRQSCCQLTAGLIPPLRLYMGGIRPLIPRDARNPRLGPIPRRPIDITWGIPLWPGGPP